MSSVSISELEKTIITRQSILNEIKQKRTAFTTTIAVACQADVKDLNKKTVRPKSVPEDDWKEIISNDEMVEKIEEGLNVLEHQLKTAKQKIEKEKKALIDGIKRLYESLSDKKEFQSNADDDEKKGPIDSTTCTTSEMPAADPSPQLKDESVADKKKIIAHPYPHEITLHGPTYAFFTDEKKQLIAPRMPGGLVQLLEDANTRDHTVLEKIKEQNQQYFASYDYQIDQLIRKTENLRSKKRKRDKQPAEA